MNKRSNEESGANLKAPVQSPFRISASLEDNLNQLEDRFRGDEALFFHRLEIRTAKPVPGCAVFLEGLAKPERVSQFVIQPILGFADNGEGENRDVLELLKSRAVSVGRIKLSDDPDLVLSALLSGDTLLFAEGCERVLVVGTAGSKTRSITEPESEKLIRGPREGFTESISTNLSLVRKRIKQDKLKFLYMEIGQRTRTNTCVAYLEDVASDKIVRELIKRLESIDIDGILDSGTIQELIKDNPYSPFDTVGFTERPDAVAGKLLEGRVAIFVDGSPNVLTVPFLLVEYFQVPADYYNNYIQTSFNRMIRFLGALLSISIPGIYVALVTFNQEMIPTPLLLSISESRRGIPFPTILEAVLMIVIFEILREAGTRIPAPVGQAVSIVGALVLGQAAVDARIVSAPMVIVVGLTGITALLTIKLQGATIVIRFLLLFLSSFIGLYGYLMGLIGLLIHVMSLRSFGVVYASPLTEINAEMIEDTVIRSPWWDMKLRPARIAWKNRVRQTGGQGGRRH
ncbi:spore germination protein [Gorillibacterium sp. sgz500922]|uniref:spore germination protein n=1 Tax=Gorillibacterium sp. sgz500922 TaxID=3446694 RepID=UPI003F661C69